MNRREFGKYVAAVATVVAAPPNFQWDMAKVEAADVLVTITDLFDNVLASGYGRFADPAIDGSITLSSIDLVTQKAGEAAKCLISRPMFEPDFPETNEIVTLPCFDAKVASVGDSIDMNTLVICAEDTVYIDSLTITSPR